MSIGTVISEIAATAGSTSIGRGPHSFAATSFDFSTILSGAYALIGLDAAGPDIAAVAIEGHPANRAETARSISVAGHLRMTRVQFSDGSSELEVSAAGNDGTQFATPPFQPDIQRPVNRIASFSDLEPEIGIDARRDADARRARWKNRVATGVDAKSRNTGTMQAMPAEMQARIETLDEGVGRLFDILT